MKIQLKYKMIEKFLNVDYIKTPIIQCNSICAFTGKSIKTGVLKKELISKTFTDYDLLKYNSDYVSIPIALLLSNVIKNNKDVLNSLRNYSFYVDETELKLLQRENMLDFLLNINSNKFQICITFSHKKHIAYRSTIQYNNQQFIITTDIGDILFDVSKTKKILPILKKWYTVYKDTNQQPTYFSKSDLLGETTPKYKNVKEYGVDKYILENNIIDKYRKTLYFKLLIHILNKNGYEN